MNKRICVFIGEIYQDYQRIVSNAIAKKANSLGYDVVFICNFGSYNDDLLYAEGEKSCINLPDCSAFDGIIVAEDVFDIDGMPDSLYEILLKTAKCPVVYLRTERDKFHSILIEDQLSIEKVVSHFTDVHGFRDICYMAGSKDFDDTAKRLNGYLSVMEQHGVEVNDHMIFYGDYWRYKGDEAIDWFMENRTSYPEAIVCANDYMAISICEALERRGVRVPEDVCVSGFDLLYEAKYNVPSLTSLEVDFVDLANNAVKIIDEVNSNKEVERVQMVSAKLRTLRSCGCGKQHELTGAVALVHDKNRLVEDTRNSFISVTEYQQTFGFDDFMTVADKYRRFMRSNRLFICFNDDSEAGFDEVENDSTYTQSMALKRIFIGEESTKYMDTHFSRKHIIPEDYWSSDRANNFCVFPIHFKNVVYGYCVAEICEGMWFDIFTQGYIMNLASAIQNSDLHQRIEQLESIRSLYQNDSLTGIYNRRGFEKFLKKAFADAKENPDKPIGIASIDMDNLKVINDTFGHTEGDKAIITLANALKSIMQDGDICARIGGDEFATIINITSEDRISSFKQELNKALKIESENIGVKFEVEASVGICVSNEAEATSIFSCIQLADRRMYENKRHRKASKGL